MSDKIYFELPGGWNQFIIDSKLCDNAVARVVGEKLLFDNDRNDYQQKTYPARIAYVGIKVYLGILYSLYSKSPEQFNGEEYKDGIKIALQPLSTNKVLSFEMIEGLRIVLISALKPEEVVIACDNYGEAVGFFYNNKQHELQNNFATVFGKDAEKKNG